MLARKSGLGVSSATVRNVLAQLEELGYVHQPHTSAGRVPTDRGYRVFVDLLLESRKPARPPPQRRRSSSAQQAGRSPLMDDLLTSVSHVVSRAARHVGFALADNDAAVSCSESNSWRSAAARVLVVVVSRGDQVTQKVVDAGEEVARRSGAGGELSEHRVRRACRLLDVREAVLDTAAAGAQPLRRTAPPCAAAGAADAGRRCPSSRRFTSKARPRCSTMQHDSGVAGAHCARCCR